MRGANGSCEFPQLTHKKEYQRQYYYANKEKIKQNRLRRVQAQKRFAVFKMKDVKWDTSSPPEFPKNVPRIFFNCQNTISKPNQISTPDKIPFQHDFQISTAGIYGLKNS